MDEYKVGDRDERPWGSYEVTAVGVNRLKEETCEKKITVLPGKILSLQSHEMRREHWRVERGTLTVILDGRKLVLRAGETIDIPFEGIHCMANTGAEPCIVFERQEGICRESDIIRYADPYGRDTESSRERRVTASIALYKALLAEIGQKVPG